MSGNLLPILTICLLAMVCHGQSQVYMDKGVGLCKTISGDIGSGFAWVFSLSMCKRWCDNVPVCKAISYDGFGNCFLVHEYNSLNAEGRGFKCYRNAARMNIS